MLKKKEIIISNLGKTVNTLSGKFNELSGTVDDLSGTVDTLSGRVDKLSGTVNTLSGRVDELTVTVDNLAHSVAKGFESMVTKQELKSLEIKLSTKIESGFSLIMDALGPMQHNYDTLKDDLSPRMSTVEARLTKVERKVSI